MRQELHDWDWGTVALYWFSCASMGLITGVVAWVIVR